MSASDPNSAIYVTDTAKDIKNKVNSVICFVFPVILFPSPILDFGNNLVAHLFNYLA